MVTEVFAAAESLRPPPVPVETTINIPEIAELMRQMMAERDQQRQHFDRLIETLVNKVAPTEAPPIYDRVLANALTALGVVALQEDDKPPVMRRKRSTPRREFKPLPAETEKAPLPVAQVIEPPAPPAPVVLDVPPTPEVPSVVVVESAAPVKEEVKISAGTRSLLDWLLEGHKNEGTGAWHILGMRTEKLSINDSLNVTPEAVKPSRATMARFLSDLKAGKYDGYIDEAITRRGLTRSDVYG